MTIAINGIDQSVPSVEDYGRAVQDIAALKAIGPSERFDKQHVYVEDQIRPYYFDLQSVTAESLPDIVLPDDAPAAGRWIKLPQMMGPPAAHASTHKGGGSDEIAAVTGALNGLMTAADKTKLDGIGALANVTSVFGRTGVVIALPGDYTTTEVDNLSSVGGANVTVALDTLNTGKMNLAGDQPLTGSWNTGAFDILTQAIQGRSGQTLTIKRGNGGTWATLGDAANVTIGLTTAYLDDVQVQLGSSGDNIWMYRVTSQTNNTLLLGMQGAEGNTVVFTHTARVSLDHAVGTPGTPTWRFHDGSATVGNWGSITHDGTNFLFASNAGGVRFSTAVGIGGITPSEPLHVNEGFGGVSTTLLLQNSLASVAGRGTQVDFKSSSTVIGQIRSSTSTGATDGGLTFSTAEAGSLSIKLQVFAGTVRVLNDIGLTLGTADNSRIQWDTTQTNPHLMLGVDSTTNLFVITDQDRIGTLNLGIPAKSTPHLVLHDGGVTPGNHTLFFQSGATLFIDNTVPTGLVDIRGGTNGVVLRHDGTAKIELNANGVGLLGAIPATDTVTIAGRLFIDQDGNSSSITLDIESTTAHVIDFGTTPLTTSGNLIECNTANALTTGGFMNFRSSSTAVNVRTLVMFTNSNLNAVGCQVLCLEQRAAKHLQTWDVATLDVGFVDFVASEDADATSALSSLTTSGAIQGHIQVEINGTKRWLAFLADPS